ncbi:MAG: polysaccharide lyase family 7 protein, partial [Verrucomicrobia bacterium]|nr:polysaccharide lyase family 7 protein [Verrucomicrobiota bacterium]
MKTLLVFAAALALGLHASAQNKPPTEQLGLPLAPAQPDPPADHMDLSHWKLTLPVDAAGTAAGHPLEISAAQLSAGYTHPEYFQRGLDGQLIFWCPVTGARTENTKYARCELREVINPTDDNVCWSAKGT